MIMAFDVNGTQYETLSAAITAANKLNPATLTLLSDAEFTNGYTIKTNLTIKGKHTLKRGASFLGALFTVDKGFSLTIDEICFDGGAEWSLNKELFFDYLYNSTKCFDNYELVSHISGPKPTVATINNKGTLHLLNIEMKNLFSVNKGWIVCAADSITKIEGPYVHNCAVAKGSALVADLSAAGVIYMEEPTLIEENFIGGNHGIFKIYSKGWIYYNGGTIRKIYGCDANGVVIGLYSGNMVMNGGLITQNYGVNGKSNGRCGTIYVHRNSTFTMNGGEISYNVGGSTGGIDSQTDTIITISDGKVIGNYCTIKKYAKYSDVRVSGTSYITGGEYTTALIADFPEGFTQYPYQDGIIRVEQIPYQAYVCIDGTIYPAQFYACIDGKIQKVYPKEV